MPGVPRKPRPYRPFSGYIPDGVISKNGLKRGFPYADVQFDPIDNEIDLRWAGGSREDQKFNNYYDYFFSGEDVKVYIDGLFDAEYELDISSLSFSIKQEKQPLFGFWSYNFDAIMYGVRIVAGSIAMYTRHPRRITDLLVQAAKIRSESVGRKLDNSNASVISVLNAQNESAEDEINIQKYWARSQLDRITYDPANKGRYPSDSNDKHIFSHHPPFNLVIIYGVQENGLVTRSTSQGPNTANPSPDNYDRILSTDYNTRLTKISNARNPMKIILQNVQLTDMSTGFETSGAPLQEAYSFIARDMYFTQADGSVNPLQNIIKDPTTSGGGSNQDPSNTQYAPPGSTSTGTAERGVSPFYAT